jgi:hypothetical protein
MRLLRLLLVVLTCSSCPKRAGILSDQTGLVHAILVQVYVLLMCRVSARGSFYSAKVRLV